MNSSSLAVFPSKQPPKSNTTSLRPSGFPGISEKKISCCLIAFVVNYKSKIVNTGKYC